MPFPRFYPGVSIKFEDMTKRKTEVSLFEKAGRTYSKRSEFFENGQLALIGVFANSANDWSWNIPVGTVKTYFENGQLESELTYDEHGSLDGESSYYDKKGNLLKKLKYAKDVLINEQVFEILESKN